VVKKFEKVGHVQS